ncbi:MULTISPECIES: hypothetical protein [unclassified Ruminococcus]|uniref:hypothetical protein n=1 Tax=unclassified Ruminococcus TaxID=2608920 RepID=UPI002108ED19|nr:MULTISPECIES: hypothetical protein [unclassified Ruminococcus]MCQ4021756.1 hypothetical protein [Ruminococcus sp. zg-924]MCQ4114200.1 hypothetical protein [Ruminococcus sp. zg-921]
MELNEKNCDELDNLEEKWYVCLQELDERNFDFNKFKLVAKETYHWLERFFYEDSLPIEIVSLLLCINSFSQGPIFSKESEAACRVADTFCDVKYYCGISGVDYEINPFGERYFKVPGAKDYHTINTDTFDLTELMNDLPHNQ